MRNVKNLSETELKNKKGFSLKVTNTVVLSLLTIVTIILIIVSFRVAASYRLANSFTEFYIEWQASAGEMTVASDFLTDQARSYVETGEKKYYDAYFYETNVTKRREKALNKFKERFDGVEAYKALERALAESRSLAETERYAMRLKAEAVGAYVASDFSEVSDVVLSPEDVALTPEEKNVKAGEMVFDSRYRTKKEQIYAETNRCVQNLAESIKSDQVDALKDLNVMLILERVFMVLLIGALFLVFLMNSKYIYKPLIRAIDRIRNDQPLNVSGATELRFLAETYNEIYDKHRKSKEKLKFKAMHDPLTKLRNRSGMDAEFKKIDYVDAAVLIIDVDDYKLVNDSHGHEVGDRVLVRLAQQLCAAFSKTDYVCRFGGDEFCIILRAEDTEGRGLKEYITEKIDNVNREMRLSTDLPAVTLSCGVGFSKDKTGEEALRVADKALYQAKRNGKDTCSFEE